MMPLLFIPVACVVAVLSLRSAAATVDRPNPPTWPPSVRVFGPEDEPGQIQAIVEKAFRKNGGRKPINHGEFSLSRFAFLFKPGEYKVDVPVGYYTQVLGLGGHPRDVVFDAPKGVFCQEGNAADLSGSLNTFWRSAENFHSRRGMLWATSQGAPLRRLILGGNLTLAEFKQGVGMGYASGGFLGNVKVDGSLVAGSQQQYCIRNADISRGVTGGVWSMVYVGSKGAPTSHCGAAKDGAGIVSVDSTPVIAEKPFIGVDDEGRYHLHVPMAKRNQAGTDFGWGSVIGFEKVYVARDFDSAAAINQWLRDDFHVVLTPGIYHLEAPLEVMRENQVLLGIGFATLVAPKGHPAVRVGNVDGVRISGILLQAGLHGSDTLLEWGNGSYQGNEMNPSFLHDIFARVGGSNNPAEAQAKAKVMLRIASGHVIGDNMWLWRADHDVAGLVRHEENPCDTGLVVTGNDVTMYGLSVEHTLKDLVQWSGENGQTFFYQSELPYDVTQAYGDEGYVGYRVNDTVHHHRAYGVGVYHYFRDHAVTVHRGIAVPPWLENSLESPLSVFLDGHGKMLHILNSKGVGTTSVSSGKATWWCEKGPDFPYLPPTTTTSVTSATVSDSTTTMTSSWTHTITLTSTPTTSVTITATVSTTSSTTSHSSTTTGSSTTTSTTISFSTTSITGTSTTSSSSSSSTTTTTNASIMGFLAKNPLTGSAGVMPWLAMAAIDGCCLLSILAVYVFYVRCMSPAEESPSSVPLSSLLRLLSRKSQGDHSRRSEASSRLSPSRGTAARMLSLPPRGASLLSTYSPGPASPPGRLANLRLQSVNSVMDSGLSSSPGGTALLSPWAGSMSRNSPLWRPHGDARVATWSRKS